RLGRSSPLSRKARGRLRLAPSLSICTEACDGRRPLMSQSNQNGQYIVISPVKDEERHVETTIRAVVNQTLRPALWVIVDDGSRDKTPEIVVRYSNHLQWIRVLRLNRETKRNLGWAEIRAFAVGYELLGGEEFDFVVKL